RRRCHGLERSLLGSQRRSIRAQTPNLGRKTSTQSLLYRPRTLQLVQFSGPQTPRLPYGPLEQPGEKRVVSNGSRRRRHKRKAALQLSSLNTDQAHLLLPCTVTEDSNMRQVRTNSMLDSGATGKGFIDETFAHTNKFAFYKLRNRRRLNVVDGRPSSAGDITHVVKLHMDIKGHKEKILFYVTKLGKYDIILGKPWLTDHNPNIDWTVNTVTFNSNHCRTYCMEKGQYQLAVSGVPPRLIPITTITNPRPSVPRRIGAPAFHTLAQKNDVEVFSLSLYEIDKRLAELGVITTPSTFVEAKAQRFDDALTDVQKMDRELQQHDKVIGYNSRDQQTPGLQDSRKLAADMYLSGA